MLQGYDRQVLRREQEKEKRVEVASEIRRTRRRSTTVVLEYQIRFEEAKIEFLDFQLELSRFLDDDHILVGGLEHDCFFLHIWEQSSQLTNIFQRG